MLVTNASAAVFCGVLAQQNPKLMSTGVAEHTSNVRRKHTDQYSTKKSRHTGTDECLEFLIADDQWHDFRIAPRHHELPSIKRDFNGGHNFRNASEHNELSDAIRDATVWKNYGNGITRDANQYNDNFQNVLEHLELLRGDITETDLLDFRDSPQLCDNEKNTIALPVYNHTNSDMYPRQEEKEQNYLGGQYSIRTNSSLTNRPRESEMFKEAIDTKATRKHRHKKRTRKRCEEAPNDCTDLYHSEQKTRSLSAGCEPRDPEPLNRVLKRKFSTKPDHKEKHYIRGSSRTFTPDSETGAKTIESSSYSAQNFNQYNQEYLPRSWTETSNGHLKVYDCPEIEGARDISSRPKSSQWLEDVEKIIQNSKLYHTWERSETRSKKKKSAVLDENQISPSVSRWRNRHHIDNSDLITNFINEVVNPLNKVNVKENPKPDPLLVGEIKVPCQSNDDACAMVKDLSEFEGDPNNVTGRDNYLDGYTQHSKGPSQFDSKQNGYVAKVTQSTLNATNNIGKPGSDCSISSNSNMSIGYLKVPALAPKRKSRSFSSLSRPVESLDVSSSTVKNKQGYGTWERSKRRIDRPKVIVSHANGRSSPIPKPLRQTLSKETISKQSQQKTKIVLKTSPNSSPKTRVFIGSTTKEPIQSVVTSSRIVNVSRVVFKVSEDKEEPRDAIIPFGCSGYYVLKRADSSSTEVTKKSIKSEKTIKSIKSDDTLISRDENNNLLSPIPKKAKSKKRVSKVSCESSDSVIARKSDSSTDRSSSKLEFWDWIDDDFIGPFRICGRGLTKPVVGELSNFYIFTEQDCSDHLKVFIAGPGMYPPKLEFDCLTDTFYRIVYWPERVGHYTIHVKWKGWHVQNSPFKVTALLPKCIVWVKKPKK